MNQNIKTLMNINLDFMSDTSTNTKNDMKLLIFTILVKKICKKKDNKYYFSNKDETEENHKLVDKWLSEILKNTSHANKTQIKGSSKKVRFILNHLCKNLSEYNIKCEKHTIDQSDDNNDIISDSCFVITGL